MTDGSSDSSDKEESKEAASEGGASAKKAKKVTGNGDSAGAGCDSGGKSATDNEHAQTFDPRLWWAAATAASANNEVLAGSGDGGSSVGSGPLMSPGLWKTPSSSAGGQSTVMAELTNLVNAHPRAGMQAGT